MSEIGILVIKKLVQALMKMVLEPKRDIDKPFLMSVEEVLASKVAARWRRAEWSGAG